MRRWGAYPVDERVIVSLSDDTAIEGVLLKRRGPLLVLADARYHHPGADPTPMDGQVYIDRDRVMFIQGGLKKD